MCASENKTHTNLQINNLIINTFSRERRNIKITWDFSFSADHGYNLTGKFSPTL